MLYKGITTGAQATGETPYGAKIKEVLLLGCILQGQVLLPRNRRKIKVINILPPGNAGGGSRRSTATKKCRTGRTL